MFKSVTLEVIGQQRLVCDSCERRVERMLIGLEGVDRVHAHADNQQIEVLFDSAVLDAAAIVQRLGDAGYEIRAGGSHADSAK